MENTKIFDFEDKLKLLCQKYNEDNYYIGKDAKDLLAEYQKEFINQSSKLLSALAGDIQTCEEIAGLMSFTFISCEADQVFWCTIIDMCNEEGFSRKITIHFNGALEYDEDSIIPNCGQIWQLIFSRGYVIGKV